MLHASPLAVKWVKDFQGRILNPLRSKFLGFEGESPEVSVNPGYKFVPPVG